MTGYFPAIWCKALAGLQLGLSVSLYQLWHDSQGLCIMSSSDESDLASEGPSWAFVGGRLHELNKLIMLWLARDKSFATGGTIDW